MDYNTTFEKRGHLYRYAIETYPAVLDNEFQIAVDMCDIQPTDILLNIPAACVPLEKYFTQTPLKYIQYETNSTFAKLMNVSHCELSTIPELPNSVDKIITLASLHHTTEEERAQFYRECHRILKDKTGMLINGDVIKGSNQDKWLNIFVNKYNSSGHNGAFWSESDTDLLVKSGFSVAVHKKSYRWTFTSQTAMVDFCRNLFGLDLATDEDIKNGIQEFLHPYNTNDDKIHIDWSLLYFISTKSQV